MLNRQFYSQVTHSNILGNQRQSLPCIENDQITSHIRLFPRHLWGEIARKDASWLSLMTRVLFHLPRVSYRARPLESAWSFQFSHRSLRWRTNQSASGSTFGVEEIDLHQAPDRTSTGWRGSIWSADRRTLSLPFTQQEVELLPFPAMSILFLFLIE